MNLRSIGLLTFLEVSRSSASWRRAVALSVCLQLSAAGAAHAQVKPRFVVAVDTSGSMLEDLSGNTTYGDGVGRPALGGDPAGLVSNGVFYGCLTTAGLDRNCDGLPNDSRIFIAKDAIKKMVFAFGDVEWSLAKFHQLHQTNVSSGQWTGSNTCANGQYYGNPQCNTRNLGTNQTGCISTIPTACQPGVNPNPTFKRWQAGDFAAQINYGVDTSVAGMCGKTYPADLLVGFPGQAPFGSEMSPTDNRASILKWMDNVETGFDSATTVGNFCNHATGGNCELRAISYTPLGSLIRTAGDYVATSKQADMKSSCRQYSTILLTDGAETCGTNPNDEAFKLAFPSAGATCPMNIPAGTPTTRTYVVGISITPTDQAGLNRIAACGGTTAAYFASSAAQLSAALSDIVSKSIPVEICNGKDDDCDGLVDEGIPHGVPVIASQPGALFCDGEARRSGAQNDQVRLRPDTSDTLPNSTTISASIVCGKVNDTCSHANFDDDCDGALDEDATNKTPCGTCPGQPDICDGIDNDCDGHTDETAGTGRDFSVCPIPCTADVPCGSGIGTCVPGHYTCSPGGILDTSTCMGGTGPQDEICDLLDNNCNGIVDDPATLARTCSTPWGATGICIPGTQFCAKLGEPAATDGYHVDGQGNPVCEGQVKPEDREICDLLDHDCNGNQFTCTQSTCIIGPQPEHVGDPCGQGVGDCTGVLVCNQTASPPALVCNAKGGSAEICDNLDNDCDGAVDEDLATGAPCGISIGECRPGIEICNPDGSTGCSGNVDPIDEICDSLDNDCDGKVDEGLALGETCGTDEGRCQSGKYMCSKGRTVCSGEVGPQLETCDCEDNDCDGKIDEDTNSNPVCPGKSVCTMCQCALPCNNSVEFAAVCPQGKAPITENNNCFCVGERCNDNNCRRQTLKLDDEVQCAPNSSDVGTCMCHNNECTFVCAGVQCGDGLICDPTDGRCRQSSCLLPQFACASNQRCGLVDAIFQCVDDPCAFQTCDDGEACRDGSCVKSCARVSCGNGQRCLDGECVTDRCNGVTCPDREVCNPENGNCTFAGICSVVGCPDGLTCDPVAATCNEDVCLRTQCGPSERCNSTSGQCELRCPASDQLFCGGQCVNPASNRLYCGAKGNCNTDDDNGDRCGSGLVCSQGECSSDCADGLVNCGGDCIDPVTDRQHCGASEDCAGSHAGQTCDAGQRCTAGRCRSTSTGSAPTNTPGRSIVAAGGGGCACSVGPGSQPIGGPATRSLAGLWLCLGLLGMSLRRRRVRALLSRWRGSSSLLLALAISSAGFLDSGCKVAGFCLDCEEADAGMSEPLPDNEAGVIDGRPDGQVVVVDTGVFDPDATINTPTDSGPIQPDACMSLELCNGVDDDCDGTVDEDADPVASNIDVQTNPNHCGACGKACAIEHAFNKCVQAQCQIDRAQGTNGCDIGFVDLDGDAKNGCEYQCASGEPDDTLCDQRDTDCDGKIDEDVDLNSDPLNCGLCGLKCSFAHAGEGARCDNKSCVLDDTKCDDGFINADGKQPTGCEYKCPVQPATAEVCNALDDDCDGKIDEDVQNSDDPRIDVDCGSTTGECELGRTICVSGAPLCNGGVSPSTETCDGKDNNCNGMTDEGFDKQTDLGNCGTCGNKCLLDSNIPNAHATLICTGGHCQVGACIGNFANTNGDYHDGCETMCTVTGQEVCDGVDNNCNGMIDDAVTAPAVVCVSRQTGVCDASIGARTALQTQGPRCMNGQLSCVPPSSIMNYESPEVTCDGLDNDCDGRIDESHPAVGQACASDGIGACATTGINVCDSNAQGGYRCNAATPPMGSAEICDDLDNNCDGTINNFAPPTKANVISGFDFVELANNVLIMKYEASRSDADGSTAGVHSGKPCSRAGRLPWANVTWDEASAACCALNANGQCDAMNKGWRLCDSSTWQTACQGAAGTCSWGYGTPMACSHANVTTYKDTCLGGENTSISCPSGVNQCATVTGSGNFAQCFSAMSLGNVFDMSGNLKEWTKTSQGANVYEQRGGSYNNLEDGRTCTFNFTVGSNSFRFPTTGFRCCYYP